MSAETILLFAVRRMFWVHMPVVGLLLLVSWLSAQWPTGVSALAALVAFAWVVLALGDWITAELRADRLGPADTAA